MIVYRVEHKDTSTGPYMNRDHCRTCDKIATIICTKHNADLKRWPAFDYFEILHIAQKIKADRNESVFGFLSLDDLKAWFSDELSVIAKCKYYIRMYYTEDIYAYSGLNQVIFNKSKAWIKIEYPIDSEIIAE